MANDSSTGNAPCRDLVFMCAGTGAVVAITCTADKRPVLARVVVFPASGGALWVDDSDVSASRATLAVRDRGFAGQYELRLSARARMLAGPGPVAGDETATGRRVPIGIQLAFDPVSRPLSLGSAEPSPAQVTLVRGDGTIAVGSVIHHAQGTAWSSVGPGGGPGGLAHCRARAVFQDGSAIFAATSDGREGRPVAALVRDTRIRPAAIRDFTVRGAEGGSAGRKLSWSGDGRSPAGADGEIRDPRQQVIVWRRDPAGAGWHSWSCSPFVFVRSGITGLGLVERRGRRSTPATPAGAAGQQPDPY